MGQRMRHMEEGFANMERNMAESFRDLPKRMHEMATKGGDEQAQSFSTSFQQARDDDGKLHKKESRQGSEISCHNGQCREMMCKNGVCRERTFEEKSGQQGGSPEPAQQMDSEKPRGVALERPQQVDRQQLEKILQKIKE